MIKLKDLKNVDKEDVLGVLGLATRPSSSERVIWALAPFGIGLLVGAGVALLLAPKPGRELREGIRTKLQRTRNGELGAGLSGNSVREADGANPEL